MLISGEAGLGKSRLVAEMVLARTGQRTHRPGAGPSVFAPVGISSWPRLVASCLGLDITKGGTVDADILRSELMALGADALFAALAVVLGLTVAEAAWLALTPAERRDQMQGAVCKLVELLAAQQMLTVVTEDLHWVDPESEEVLDRIAALLSRLPILLIATSRPEWHCRLAPAAVAAGAEAGAAVREIPALPADRPA